MLEDEQQGECVICECAGFKESCSLGGEARASGFANILIGKAKNLPPLVTNPVTLVYSSILVYSATKTCYKAKIKSQKDLNIQINNDQNGLLSVLNIRSKMHFKLPAGQF